MHNNAVANINKRFEKMDYSPHFFLDRPQETETEECYHSVENEFQYHNVCVSVES